MIVPQDNLPSQPAPVWNWKDVLLIVAGIVLIFLIGLLGVNLYATWTGSVLSSDQGPTIELSVGLTALEGLALIGAVYLLGLRRKNYSWAVVGLKNPGNRWLNIALLLGLAVIPASGLIAILVQQLLGLPPDNPQLPFLAPGGYSTFGAVGMFLFGGIIVPFAEELFFRGVLYLWLRQRFGFWIGITVSSVLFGILHGDISVGVAAACLGFVLAWSYEKSQSLWSPVIIHVLNNGAKILLLYLLLATGINLGI